MARIPPQKPRRERRKRNHAGWLLLALTLGMTAALILALYLLER